MADKPDELTVGENDIAIVGMAAHLPGAPTISKYWENLRDGVESICKLSEQELVESGELPERLHHKNYVPHAALLDGFECFDADFFGFSPKEAAIMDPQHRQFLEVAWEAFENAGHPPEKFDGPIGVYAGCGMGSYFYFNVCSNPDLVDSVGMFLLRHTGNDKDFLSTRLSHVFDLKGPSINMQTACSTSLVATHYACQSLLMGECDMALAGGVTIDLPQGRGYIFEDGEILSPDGHCHAFDHRAEGTVFGSGAGVVVLRRMADAVKDGDHIWAVIKGTAVNNDGAAKAGYLAPSVDGQSQAITEAHAVAGITADTVDYVECHGTGTYLGDPIEIAALTEAFRETTDEVGYCGVGSVKTNIGHTDTAAGVASLIKASLGLHHQQIPPSLGYEKPNPAIDFETSPFSVNAELKDWVSFAGPRRAAVNSLGVGGTNAHAIIQEAPQRAASEPSDWPYQILTISGRSKSAVDANAKSLAEYLRQNPEVSLDDVAFTLKEGRRGFEKRRVIVAADTLEAARYLEGESPRRVFSHTQIAEEPDVVFMFPGGGAQFINMGRDLYETEPDFQEWIDRGLEILQPKLDYDIRAIWLPDSGGEEAATERLRQPSVQLPLIMIVEYALAQLWMSWGVQPAALVGHSMGENTAACVSGVMSFEDCIGLVHLRGQLFDTVPAGGMLSASLAADDLAKYLGDDLDMASINAPELSVASGPQAALDALQAKLEADDVDCQRIPIDIAAHSRMLEPILNDFGAFLRGIKLSPPKIPFVSNRNGDFITDADATDPDYWVAHLRGTIHFADCITTLSQEKDRVFLEVGPGKALSSLAQMHTAVETNQVLSSLRHPDEIIADDKYFLEVIGRLWACGVEADWAQIWGETKRNRLPLPTYAFQRSPYFIEPGQALNNAPSSFLMRSGEVDDWYYKPVWRPKLAECEFDIEAGIEQADPQTWLFFVDDTGVGVRAAARLRNAGHEVIEVRPGDAFGRSKDGNYIIAPERGREDYDNLVQDLTARGLAPARIAHFWLLTDKEDFRPGSSVFHRNQEQGFFSLMFLAQAITEENLPKPMHLSVITSGAMKVRGEPLSHPEKMTAMGPCKVIPRELPGVTCSVLDVATPWANAGESRRRRKNDKTDEMRDRLAHRILEDLLAIPSNNVAAIRGDKRLEQTFRKADIKLDENGDLPAIRNGGAYLVTGGFGGIGLTISKRLIEDHDAKIILLGRSELPDRAGWDDYIRSHGPYDKVTSRIQAVRVLERLGGDVTVVTADVCNVEEMRRVAVSADENFGGIVGVIHAAGVIDDAPLLAKSVSSVEDVFTPKIHGTQVLDEVFPDGSIDWLVLFSSSSTVTAPVGQIDYVAANEYLNAYAKSRANDKTHVVAINWGIWNEVGMAADAVAERTGDRPPVPVLAADVPLLDEATFDTAGHRLFAARYTTENQWFLNEHRTKSGDAIVPGTGYLEIAAQALEAQGETGGFEIRDLLFLRPLQVDDTESRDIQVRLKRSDEGYGFEVSSGVTVDGRQAFELNAQATLALLPLATPAKIDLTDIQARCGVVEKAGPTGFIRSRQEKHLNFGERWRVLKNFALGDDEGIAQLALPEMAHGDISDGYRLHPALMDLATGWAMQLIKGYEPTNLWVPVSYASVKIHKPLPQMVYSWVRNAAENNADSPFATFDVTLIDADGEVLVEVQGFSIRQLESETEFSKAKRPTAKEVEFADGNSSLTSQPLSPAEERLHHNLSQGILPQEGVIAFETVLASRLSQVVVSSLDLEALISQAGMSSGSEEKSGQKFQRPELDSDYVEPTNDIERTLVGFWEELLGVQQVGIEDSFFDLGGHSLIAVRLFAMVKKSYRIEFPISVLFEAPTISRCAELIAERVGPATDTGGESAETGDANRPTQRRFTHLVAMHEGEGGSKTPFFLVAGMFGNVLNLRHLAHLLGADRPFFGLQAKGLYGDQEPHRSLVEAATDYIAEMQVIQPHGPYLLGGFSGGGITAYEIAHQLEAAGEEVALLVMLDTPLPMNERLSLKDRMSIQMQQLRKKGPGYISQWVKNRIAWEIEKRRGHSGEEEYANPETQFHNAEIEEAFLESIGQYEVRPWNGPLRLFRPPLSGEWEVYGGRMVNDERDYLYADNNWTKWVPTIEVTEVPGNHDSMVLEPNVRVLAARMKASIEDAEKKLAQSHRTDKGWAGKTAAE